MPEGLYCGADLCAVESMGRDSVSSAQTAGQERQQASLDQIADLAFLQFQPLCDLGNGEPGRLGPGRVQPEVMVDEIGADLGCCPGLARAGEKPALVQLRCELGLRNLLAQLVMALRSGEVLGLRVRDLDAGATVLVVEGTKTRNARRRLEIKSAPLRSLLARHCANLSPSNLIFGNGRTKPYHTNRLHKALEKYCAKAGVPVVCPHSLRGLHSSIAVTRGATSQLVAEALGHGTDAITPKHYITAEALDSARSTRIAEALDSKPASPDLSHLESLLRQLAPAQLQTLMASVAKGR